MEHDKKRIAIFTDSFFPQINGVVTATMNLVKSLADRGYYILIVAPSDKYLDTFSYPNIEIKQMWGFSAGFYEGFKFTKLDTFGILKFIKEKKIDIIHFMTPLTVAYVGIKIAKKLNIPVIGTFHTFIADPTYLKNWKIIGESKQAQKVAWRYTNLFYDSANLVTAPSLATLEEMKKNGCVSEGKYISNGIDENIFDLSDEKTKSIREKYRLNDKTVLFVGRVSHEKNISVLVETFVKVAQENSEVTFLIVGDGPVSKQLKQQIDNYNLNNRIVFAGAIPHDDLVRSGILKACYIFTTASVTENQPMTILEAQCNGLVCVGPNARGIPDLIHDGKNGVLVPPNDVDAAKNAIIRLLSDDKLYLQMKETTAKEITMHYLENVVDEWESTYSEVIGKFKSGGLKCTQGFNYLLDVVPMFVKLVLSNLFNAVLNIFK